MLTGTASPDIPSIPLPGFIFGLFSYEVDLIREKTVAVEPSEDKPAESIVVQEGELAFFAFLLPFLTFTCRIGPHPTPSSPALPIYEE